MKLIKVIRTLEYIGEEKNLENHLTARFVKPFQHISGCTIREIELTKSDFDERTTAELKSIQRAFDLVAELNKISEDLRGSYTFEITSFDVRTATDSHTVFHHILHSCKQIRSKE